MFKLIYQYLSQLYSLFIFKFTHMIHEKKTLIGGSFHATLYTDLELTTLTQIKTVISSSLSFGHRTQKFREGRCTFERTNAVLGTWFLDSHEMHVYMCAEAPWAQELILVCTIGPIQKTRSREREWVNKKETYMIPCFLSLSCTFFLSSNRWSRIFLFAVVRAIQN